MALPVAIFVGEAREWIPDLLAMAKDLKASVQIQNYRNKCFLPKRGFRDKFSSLFVNRFEYQDY